MDRLPGDMAWWKTSSNDIPLKLKCLTNIWLISYWFLQVTLSWPDTLAAIQSACCDAVAWAEWKKKSFIISSAYSEKIISEISVAESEFFLLLKLLLAQSEQIYFLKLLRSEVKNIFFKIGREWKTSSGAQTSSLSKIEALDRHLIQCGGAFIKWLNFSKMWKPFNEIPTRRKIEICTL